MYAIFRLIDVLQLLPLSRVCRDWKRLINKSRLRKVMNFSFWDISANEQHLTPMLFHASLHTVKIAGLPTPAVINHAITVLAENCPHLSVLVLECCMDINEESWRIIGAAPWPRLTHLSLHGCFIENKDLATILPTVSLLTVLDIAENFVTDDGLACITGHTPNLRCLLLCENDDITSASTVPLFDAVGSHLTQLSLIRPDIDLLEALPTACVCLRVLALDFRWTDVFPIDAIFGCLQRLTRLTHLQLRNGLGPMGLGQKLHNGCPSRLEHLALLQVPVDDHLLIDIARTCGTHLRCLIIKSASPITAVGLTEVANRCTAIEYLKLDLTQSSKKDPTIANVVSTMAQLRIFFIIADCFFTKAIKRTLAGIMPNVLLPDIWDDPERWQFPDIASTAL